MLNFFKRKPPPPAPRRTQPRTAAAGSKSTPTAEPPPLPEVTEGNLESDWALWEDSVAFQDSQMPSGFNELESVRTREEKTGKEDSDPYAAVKRRGG